MLALMLTLQKSEKSMKTYLIDALKALKSETVRVRFISPVRPFTLTPADDSENFIQLITPVRTN